MLYSVASPGHFEPLFFLLENYVFIVISTPNLQRAPFQSVIQFHYHNSTTDLVLSLMHIKGFCPSSKAMLLYGELLLVLWLQ